MLADLARFERYFGGLRRLLREPLTLDDCRRNISRQLARREESFLQLLEKGVYEHPRSPYLGLLRNAGVELGDVRALVRDQGLETALASLHDAGVHVSLEEFKGLRPDPASSAEDFDNPLLIRHFVGRSGGSRGSGRAIPVDFRRVEYDACHHGVFLAAHGLLERPTAVWYPVPPMTVGLVQALYHAKLRRPAERWYSQQPLARRGRLKLALLVAGTWAAARSAGTSLPFPRQLSSSAASELAVWLAAAARRGTPALLHCNPSSAVRVCLAAREGGLDISGTYFRMGGEPYTKAKADLVAAAGCGAACNYYMTEVGFIGTACPDATALGDVHVALDKVALTQRSRTLPDGTSASGMFVTTLHPATPKVMINVESDDFGVLERRSCSCEIGRLGLDLHLHTIRSFEKLTSAGTSFQGSEVLTLVEHVLPGRFGGESADYQIVETERGGRSRVQIVVSPRVGAVDESAVVRAVQDFLRARGDRAELMATAWADASTLEVIRREPHQTAAGKVLALHVLEEP